MKGQFSVKLAEQISSLAEECLQPENARIASAQINKLFGRKSTRIKLEVKEHWIHQNIKCKGLCQRFVVGNPSKPTICGCGRDKSEHCYEALTAGESNTEKWSSKEDSPETGTMAYGKIKFLKEDTDQTPDFIRVSDEMCATKEGLDTIIELMTKEELWGMDEQREPNLLISVTGGAKDFEVAPQLKTNFAKGLCAAAKSANAWIVTGGTDTGVMKIVGDAVYNHSGEITTIGIATWGIVRGNDKLERTGHNAHKGGSATFDYDGVTEKTGSMAPINPHHTHFIFVDNGTDRKFGGEMEFRAKLERKITQTYPINKSGTQKQIPIIQVILNGGPNSAKTCLLSMKEDIPLLVIKGSKNCADVIARAHSLSTYNAGRRMLSPQAKKLVDEEIETHFKSSPQSVKTDIMGYVEEILKMDHLLTIYTLESKALDHALLFALIKSKTDNNSAIEQMSMAIKWDRPSLAREILSLETVQFNKIQMESCLEQAILMDRKDFISIFLEEGVEMKQFLTYERLKEMYRYKPEGTTHIGKKRFFKVVSRLLPTIQRQEIELVDIGALLCQILEGGFRNPLKNINLNKPVDNAYDMLLVYSAMNDCKEMADALWDPCNSPISTALIAYRIYKFHAEYTSGLTAYDNESAEIAMEEANKYEEYACKSLSRCTKVFDKDDTFLLLSTPHSFWDGHTLISIAMTVGSDKFLAHGAVQTFLNEVWMGELKSSQSFIKILMCSVLIFPFPLLLKYDERTRTPDEIQEFLAVEKQQATLALEKQLADQHAHTHRNNIEMGEQDAAKKIATTAKKIARDSLENKRKYKIKWYQKFGACYSSPLVKFQLNFILYLAFIVLYAYTLIIDHGSACTISGSSSLTGVELYLLIYVLGTLPTEILQLVQNGATQPFQKLVKHFGGSFFNCLDGLAILTYFISFFIRILEAPTPAADSSHNGCEHHLPVLNVFADQDFTWYNFGHIVNIFCFLFYGMRAMDFLKLSPEMGPKVIMIFAMIKDLIFFIILLLLFVFIYAVGVQAILRPNKDTSPNNDDYMIDFVFYRPFLMSMGEFGIEDFVSDFQLDHCCPDDTTNTETCGLHVDCSTEDYVLSTLLANNSIARAHYYIFITLTIVYILLANILLVNLLIAIFSNTYERVQENSQVLYLVQRAEMIIEFDCRSNLPNPFSLPEHLFMFCKWLYNICNKKKNRDMRRVRLTVDPRFHKMTKIERACCDDYLAHREDEDEDYIKDTLKDLKDSIKNMQTFLDNSGAGHAVATPAKEDTDVCSVDDGGKAGLNLALSMALSQQKHLDDLPLRIAIGAPIEIHTDARTTPYPGTDLERFPLDDAKVPWNVPLPDYKPTEYIKPRPENHPHHHDDEKLHPDLVHSFNKFYDGINRTSFLGKYGLDKETNRPLNPRGRTGLSGKGKLKRWGPNHQGDVIVTRWQLNAEGGDVRGPDGRRVLEFVAMHKHGQWAIPGGRVVEGEKLVDTLEREFSEEALGSQNMTDEQRTKTMLMVDMAFGLGINVYQGYVDDPTNTDNAWYETTSLNYHDSDGSSFGNFPLDGGLDEDGATKKAMWITLDKNIDLYANHEWIMEKVCFHRNAYCPIQKNENIKLGAKRSSKWAFFINPAAPAGQEDEKPEPAAPAVQEEEESEPVPPIPLVRLGSRSVIRAEPEPDKHEATIVYKVEATKVENEESSDT